MEWDLSFTTTRRIVGNFLEFWNYVAVFEGFLGVNFRDFSSVELNNWIDFVYLMFWFGN